MQLVQSMKNFIAGIATKFSSVQPLIYRMYAGNGIRGVSTKRNFAQYSENGYRKNVVAYRSINIIARSAAKIPLKVMIGDKEADKTHPLMKLLSRPNPWLSGQQFVENGLAYLLLSGNSYVEGIGPDGKPPLELWVHRPDRMRVVPGAYGVAGYSYEAGGEVKSWPADPVNGTSPIMHVKFFHPLDDWYGMSPIEAAAFAIDQHNEAGAWNQSLLQNSARPSGALVYSNPAGGQLSDKQFEKLKEEINATMSGSRNAGRIPILENGLSWQQMSMSPADMDWIEGKHVSAREIAVTFGMPPQMLGIPGDSTYSNYHEARQALYEDTVLPLLDQFIDNLNVWLAPKYGDEVRIVMDVKDIPALSPKREKIWGMVQTADWLSINEKREATGYERSDLPEADELWVKSGVMPLDGSTEPPETEEVDEDGKPIATDEGAEEEDEEEDGKPKPKPKKSGPVTHRKYIWEK